MSDRAVIAIVALGVVMMCGVAFMRVLARIMREVSRVSSPGHPRSPPGGICSTRERAISCASTITRSRPARSIDISTCST